MSKWMRILRNVALGCLAVGLVLCLIGWIAGADLRRIKKDRVDELFNGFDYGLSTINVQEDGSMIIDGKQVSTSISQDVPEKKLIFDHFSDLSADIGVSTLSIQTGEDYSLMILQGEGCRFTYQMKDGCLILKEKTERKMGKQNSSKIFITVPEKALLGKIHIEQGVGDISLSDLTAEELEISCGVGNTCLEGISAAVLDMDGGTGDIDGKNLMVSKELDVDGGVGDITLQGDFCGEIEIDSGVGDCNICFAQPEHLYHIQMDKGVGKAELCGREIKDHKYKQGSSSADNHIKASCGVGNLCINFADYCGTEHTNGHHPE